MKIQAGPISKNILKRWFFMNIRKIEKLSGKELLLGFFYFFLSADFF